MTSVQDRHLKMENSDKWSVREQLCLFSAVSRCGDQNWMTVSRALKPFSDPNRPADWFHQKNCASQYNLLLGNAEIPKRKKRVSGMETALDTPLENILRRLHAERQVELNKLLAEEKAEYLKLQEDMAVLQSGKVSEEQLDRWCKEIEEEENQKEQEITAHTQWLKEREQSKQEMSWGSNTPTSIAGHKRKNSDSLDSLIESELAEEVQQQHQTYPQTPESMKPAPSPLLTSLLKSPSQVPNTSMLHTAITNRHCTPSTNTNPMIASLLNSSTGVTVSPGLQQLVSTAIGQEATIEEDQQPPIGNDILDDANMPNIKIDDLANSILVQDGPLPEIKKEEVDDIISEIIESAHDIVSDPEQHLQLDGNGDININLGLDDFDEDDEIIQEVVESKEDTQEEVKVEEKPSAPIVVDPFEFQEDPVIHLEPSVKVSNLVKQDSKQHVPQYQQQTQPQQPQQQQSLPEMEAEEINEVIKEVTAEETREDDIQKEEIQNAKEEEKDQELSEKKEDESEAVEKIIGKPVLDTIKMEENVLPGSVEIVEVVGIEEDEIDKELDKSQIQDIVHSMKSNDSEDIKSSSTEIEEEKIKTETEESSPPESKDTASIATFEESSEASDMTGDNKKDVPLISEAQEITSVLTPDFTDGLYDEMNMEVKVDKSGKAKRDYSRTKKKEEKGFDMLLAIEKAQLEDSELTEENLSDNTTDNEKKDTKLKVKSENDRSNSPWTEEDDSAGRSKRRYSTPATPNDSVPNSPASSSAFYYEDDRDYRNWKKSVMLVYNRLATNKYASLFLKHITDDQAPGYSSTVYRAMDLQTIKKNIENGTIRTTLEFKRDTMLMFMNALMYNRTNETIYNMALQMQQESLEPIEILMSAEKQNDGAPLRRETRTSESGTKRKRTITEETLLKPKKRKED